MLCYVLSQYHIFWQLSPYTLYWQAEWQVPAFRLLDRVILYPIHVTYSTAWCWWQHVPPIINGTLKQLGILSICLFYSMDATVGHVLTEDAWTGEYNKASGQEEIIKTGNKGRERFWRTRLLQSSTSHSAERSVVMVCSTMASFNQLIRCYTQYASKCLLAGNNEWSTRKGRDEQLSPEPDSIPGEAVWRFGFRRSDFPVIWLQSDRTMMCRAF